MLTSEENRIIKGCIQGKSQCQKQLYLEYGPIVRGVCHRYAANLEDEKDLFHDIFVSILTNMKDVKEFTSLYGWIYAVSVNKSVDYYRKRFRYEINSLEECEEIADQTPPCMAEVLSKERFVQILNELPDKARVIINMYLIDDIPEQKIADITGESLNYVRVTVYRTKKRLQKKIREFLHGEDFEI